LQVGEVVSTIPTIGFNVETVQHNKIKFQVWDLGQLKVLAPQKFLHALHALSSHTQVKICMTC
jgi:hypothetical protein